MAEAGYLLPRAVFIDGTHIKANANTKKQVKEQIPAAAKHYAKELMEKVNAGREAHGKKPFDDDNDDDPPAPAKKRKDNTSKKKLARRKKEKNRTVTKSVTDLDSGLFVKGEHKKQFAYEAHTACDKNGFVLETVETPGNVHDSVAFDEVYDKVTENFPPAETKISQSWRENWVNLSTYFKYPQEVCRLIYMTNAIEGFNQQLRKVTKSKSVFPTDDSLLKMLYLAMMDITKKWTGRRQDWSLIHSQLSVFIADRMPD